MQTHDDYMDDTVYSECCYAPIMGEVVDGIGLCSRCKEWSGVERNPDGGDE